jgi:rare lipoprotein A
MATAVHASRPALNTALAALVLVVLAGCSSAPKRAGDNTVRSGPAPSGERDGADASPPADLAKVPDAEPRVEPIRAGGANKPYEVLGKDYSPKRSDDAMTERGLASWYGKKFHGRRTASGEPYDMYAMTAAHKTMPLPSYARVRHLKTGREIIVRVNDRGPFHADRVIDLSYTAALKLGVLRGVAMVEVERLTNEDIRTGAWKRGGTSAPDEPVTMTASTEPANEAPAMASPPAVAPDRTTPVDSTLTASVSTAPGYWLQLGAFRQRDGAEQFQRRVVAEADWLSPLLAVTSDASLHRLQAGPYASRSEAQEAAGRVRELLKLVPAIVERR